MKSLDTRDPFWRALAIGIVYGAPLTAVGELLRHGQEYHPLWRAIGLVLTLPGVLYGGMTGRDVFVSPLSMSVYFLAQMGFYAVVVFLFTAVVRFFQAPPRKKAGW
mgnify:CR=1 FL=1